MKEQGKEMKMKETFKKNCQKNTLEWNKKEKKWQLEKNRVRKRKEKRKKWKSEMRMTIGR